MAHADRERFLFGIIGDAVPWNSRCNPEMGIAPSIRRTAVARRGSLGTQLKPGDERIAERTIAVVIEFK